MHSDTKTAYTLLVIAVLSYLLKFGLYVFLARFLMAERFGDLQIAIQVLSISTTLMLFGTNIGVLRYLAVFEKNNNKELAREYISWNLKLLTRTFLMTMILALLVFFVIFLLDKFHIHDLSQYHLAAFTLWITPFSALSVLLSSYLLSQGKLYFPTMITSLLKYAVELILFMVAILFFKISVVNNLSLITPLLITFILLSILGFLFINSETIFNLRSVFNSHDSTPKNQTEWFSSSRKFIVNNVSYMLLCTLDLIIVEIFEHHENSVGYYAAALTCSGIIWLAPMNLYQAIKPKISSLIKSRDGRLKLQANADKINSVVFFIVTLSTLLIIVFSKELLALFGPGYSLGQTTLIFLCLGSFVRGSSKFSALLLVFSGFEALSLRICLLEILVITIVGSIATHRYGVLGMAIVSSCTMIGAGVITAAYARKKVGIRSTLFF